MDDLLNSRGLPDEGEVNGNQIKVVKVTTALGKLRAEHGVSFEVELDFEGSRRLDSSKISSEWFLDVTSSSKMWGALPTGASQLADLLLPLKCTPTVELPRFTFILGAKQLSHPTLFKGLEDQILAGDPLIRLEFYNGKDLENCVFSFPFRCSSILNALTSTRNDINIVHHGKLPSGAFPKKKGILRRIKEYGKFVAWVLGPTIYTSLNWGITAVPSVLSYAKAILPSWVLPIWNYRASLKEILAPLRPISEYAAWRLGVISELIKTATGPDQSKLLEEAAKLVNKIDPLSMNQFSTIPNVLKELADKQSLASRAMSFMSFVNIMWIASIIIIGVSLGPAIFYTLTPLSNLLKRFCIWSWKKIIKPTAKKCHEYGIFEILAWSITFITLIDSHRIPKDTGNFIALTSVAMAAVSTAYSTFNHGLGFVKSLSYDGRIQLPCAFLFSFLTPIAYQFNSDFFGFFATLSAYTIIVSTDIGSRLCSLIGFDDGDPALRASSSSALLLTAFTVFQKVGLPYLFNAEIAEKILGVLSLPVAILGPLTLHSGLNLYSTDNYIPFHLGKRNFLMIASLAINLLVGIFIAPETGIGSTAAAFAYLWLNQKYIEFHARKGWNGWLLALLIGLSIYFLALKFHDNPHFVIDLFSGKIRTPVQL